VFSTSDEVAKGVLDHYMFPISGALHFQRGGGVQTGSEFLNANATGIPQIHTQNTHNDPPANIDKMYN
jgi:hypothetical protein